MIDSSKKVPPLWLRYIAPAYKYFYENRRNKYLNKRALIGSVPIISIGAISLGGSGKTPLLNLILEDLNLKHLTSSVIVKSTGNRSANPASDEAILIKKISDLTEVITAKNKIEAVKQINIEKIQPDLIILDDGFQIFSLKKLEIVIVRPEEILNPSLMLPLGYFRENINALSRANHLVIRDDKRNQEIETTITKINEKLQIHYAKDDIYNIVRLSDWINTNKYKDQAKISNSMLDNFVKLPKILLWAGTAKPEMIAIDILNKYGLNLEIIPTIDHDQNICQLMALQKKKQIVFITEKDACRFKSKFIKMEQNDISNIYVILHRFKWISKSPSFQFYKEAKRLYEANYI